MSNSGIGGDAMSDEKGHKGDLGHSFWTTAQKVQTVLGILAGAGTVILFFLNPQVSGALSHMFNMFMLFFGKQFDSIRPVVASTTASVLADVATLASALAACLSIIGTIKQYKNFKDREQVDSEQLVALDKQLQEARRDFYRVIEGRSGKTLPLRLPFKP